MQTTINTIVQLKVTGFVPFNKTEKKPAGIKLQCRYVRSEGGLGHFEIKNYGLSENDAKALKGKSIQLPDCSVFRPEGDYAQSYWSSTGTPVELKQNIDKVIVNTVMQGKVEAIEPFAGEKMSGYSLFFVTQNDDAETVYSVKMVSMNETEAKALLHKEVRIEQLKPLSKTSFITEAKPSLQNRPAA